MTLNGLVLEPFPALSAIPNIRVYQPAEGDPYIPGPNGIHTYRIEDVVVFADDTSVRLTLVKQTKSKRPRDLHRGGRIFATLDHVKGWLSEDDATALVQAIATADLPHFRQDAPTYWRTCPNHPGRRTMHASGLCQLCRHDSDTPVPIAAALSPGTYIPEDEIRAAIDAAHERGEDPTLALPVEMVAPQQVMTVAVRVSVPVTDWAEARNVNGTAEDAREDLRDWLADALEARFPISGVRPAVRVEP
jgi:hypothetical protein